MQMLPLLAVDFDSIILPPEHRFKRRILGVLKWWRWLDWKLERFTIRWYRLDPQANLAAYWLVDQGMRVSVIVRRRYTLGLHTAVESILDQLGGYPAATVPTCHLIPTDLDIQEQALHIRQFCNQYGAHRFFTRDWELARCLPGSLVTFVKEWDQSILR